MSNDLKVGDLIAVNRFYGAEVSLHKIVKVTPTMYVTKHGTRFRKGSLRIVGANTLGSFSGRIPTARDMMLVRILKAEKAVKALIVTEENVAAIEAMLKDIAK